MVKEPPPFPEELDFIWKTFTKLANRRQVGMVANPLSYQEIEAFTRLERVDLRPWEVELICKVDDAVLRCLNPSKGSPDGSVPAQDAQGVRNLLRTVAIKKAAQK